VDAAQLWATQQQRLRELADWRLRGKVAYRLPDAAGSASLDWRQEQGSSELRLSGPLGAGAVRISTEGPLLKLSRDGIDRLYPADAAPWLGGDRLLPIPVEALQFWLRGLPAPDTPVHTLRSGEGHILELVQEGWHLSYGDFQRYDDLLLPGRINIAVPGAQLSLRVLLRDWELQ